VLKKEVKSVRVREPTTNREESSQSVAGLSTCSVSLAIMPLMAACSIRSRLRADLLMWPSASDKPNGAYIVI